MAQRVRDRLVRSTVELMARHGVAGTGIAELLAHSAVSRRSVYLHFPDGKRELVAAATTLAGADLGALIESLGATKRPADAVGEFVSFWAAHLESTDFSSGCPIVAAALGRHEAPHAADAAGDVFGQWIDLLGGILRRTGVDDDAALTAATTVVTAIEGAVVVSLARRSTEPLDRTGSHLVQYIGTLPARSEPVG